MKFLALLLLISFTYRGISQQPDSSSIRYDRHGAAMAVMGLVLTEGAIVGLSVYAGKTHAAGDKVVGWLYAGASAAAFLYGLLTGSA